MKSWPYLVALAILIGTIGFIESMSHGDIILQKESFSGFPLTLANRWQGKELGMDQDVLDILKVSDYMMRYYQPISVSADTHNQPLLSPISLYVGYYESQRTGATYHSPKNCLPGAGWNFAESGIVSIPITQSDSDKRSISVNKVLIQKGTQKQMVIYWYHDRGRTIASEYMAKAYMIWDAMTQNRTDGALVRIIVPVKDTPEEAFQTGVIFLTDMWPELLNHMPSSIPT
ncbi:MAG: EpsI family protein [Nitrospirota bacterium]|nr:EpsI family protein [Nitrospirota bacterium]